MDSTEENWTCRGQNGRTRFTPLAYQFVKNRRYRLGKALTNQLLFEQVGLKGETMNLVSANSVTSVDWTRGSLIAQKQQPLAWHKAYFDAPEGDEPLALDMGSMGKGEVWVNGESLGRYWTQSAAGNCNGCSYTGVYKPPKCQFGCGQPTQRWYSL